MRSSIRWTFFVLGLACAQGAVAQYKYVGPDGRVTYSDQPPPAGIRTVEQKKLGSTVASSTAALPFAVQQARTQFPVTLYTGEKCVPCEDARNYLRNRGVPFSERTVSSNEDLALFKQQSPDGTVPVIAVGARRSSGFSQAAWSGLLDDAGYPQTSLLPRDFQNVAPTPLSPNTRLPAQAVGTAAGSSPAPQAQSRGPASVPGGGVPAAQPAAPPPASAPSGFRF